jgi:hypothetical protein
MQMQLQLLPPGGVAEDLVRNALGFRSTASDGDACSGRGEYIETVGGADFVNSKHVGAVADVDCMLNDLCQED